MGRYILNNIAIRSWWLAPYTYVEGIGEERRHERRLTREEFELLKRCDGEADIPGSELLDSLLERKLLRKAADGEKTDPFLLHRSYDNRLVPCMALYVTERCNFNCLHCYEAVSNERPRREISLEDCRRILSEARECGVQNVTIIGGEPFMHKGLMDIIRCVYENEMTIDRIYTNGFFITEAFLDELRTIDQHILFNVSYDGAGFHDWMRNFKGAEKDLIKKISIAVNKGYRVRAAMTLNRVNRSAAWETLLQMEEIGVHEMRVIRTAESPRWLMNAGDACMSFEEYYDDLTELCRKYAEADRKIILNAFHFAKVIPWAKVYEMAPVKCAASDYKPGMVSCTHARESITVLPDGEVFPCPPSVGEYQAAGLAFGNVLKQGLESMLQDSPYLSFVCRGVHTIRENDSKCASCPYFPQCQGGCRLFAERLSGSTFAHDPSKCAFYENRYDLKIEEALKGYRCLQKVERDEELS